MQPTIENVAENDSAFFYTQKDDFTLVYVSLTGNTRRFVNKLPFNSKEWTPNLKLDKSFFFITYTTGKGEIPQGVEEWLLKNRDNLRGVASSGNTNFKENFAAAGRKLAAKFQVPLISTFELSGTKKDIDVFTERILWLLNSN